MSSVRYGIAVAHDWNDKEGGQGCVLKLDLPEKWGHFLRNRPTLFYLNRSARIILAVAFGVGRNIENLRGKEIVVPENDDFEGGFLAGKRPLEVLREFITLADANLRRLGRKSKNIKILLDGLGRYEIYLSGEVEETVIPEPKEEVVETSIASEPLVQSVSQPVLVNGEGKVQVLVDKPQRCGRRNKNKSNVAKACPKSFSQPGQIRAQKYREDFIEKMGSAERLKEKLFLLDQVGKLKEFLLRWLGWGGYEPSSYTKIAKDMGIPLGSMGEMKEQIKRILAGESLAESKEAECLESIPLSEPADVSDVVPLEKNNSKDSGRVIEEEVSEEQKAAPVSCDEVEESTMPEQEAVKELIVEAKSTVFLKSAEKKADLDTPCCEEEVLDLKISSGIIHLSLDPTPPGMSWWEWQEECIVRETQGDMNMDSKRLEFDKRGNAVAYLFFHSKLTGVTVLCSLREPFQLKVIHAWRNPSEFDLPSKKEERRNVISNKVIVEKA